MNGLNRTILFDNIEEHSLQAMLSCLGARSVRYPKDGYILLAGDPVDHIGVLLEGAAYIVKETADGERSILATLSAGDYFAEALCCAGVTESPVSVIATADSTVLLLEFRRILRTCPSSCGFHAQLIENMLRILAHKNLLLQGRMDILGKKTLRHKVLRYLQSIPAAQDGTIVIPLNREELADYLCTDRSALSHELARMKKDGWIDYHKNRFTLLR